MREMPDIHVDLKLCVAHMYMYMTVVTVLSDINSSTAPLFTVGAQKLTILPFWLSLRNPLLFIRVVAIPLLCILRYILTFSKIVMATVAKVDTRPGSHSVDILSTF